MICNKCGNQVAEGLQFCPNCGNSLASQPVIPTPQPVQQPVYSQPTNIPQPMYNGQQPMYTQQPQKSGSNKGCIIAAVIVGVVLLLGLLFVGLFFKAVVDTIDEAEKQVREEESNINEKYDNYSSNLESNINSSLNNNSTINSNSNTTTSNSNTTTTTGTFSVGGFRFNTPVGYTATTSGSNIVLMSGSKQIGINVISGSYENLKANKSQLSKAFAQSGYTVSNIQTGTYNGVEFLSGEAVIQNYKLIIAYAKIDASHIAVVSTANGATPTRADYTLLSEIAVSLKTARKA
jgi:hypothetical protein